MSSLSNAVHKKEEEKLNDLVTLLKSATKAIFPLSKFLKESLEKAKRYFKLYSY
jgi:hypothetical protein